MPHTFESRRAEYVELLFQAEISVAWHIRLANFYGKYLDNKSRYEAVAKIAKIPALLIAAIHAKEASSKFSCNLHNGQDLDMVTTIVPKGRGPFKNWEDSAIDALGMKRDLIASISKHGEKWTIPQCLYFAEAYNGFGYIKHGINSPYLWCGTNRYVKGGYTKDGHYDPEHVINNVGVAAVLMGMKSELT